MLPVGDDGSGVRPTFIPLSGDATNIVRSITWTGWGQPTAIGEGTTTVEGCVPDCAGGTQTPTPTALLASNLRDGEYHTLTETWYGYQSVVYPLPYTAGGSYPGASTQLINADLLFDDYFNAIDQGAYSAAYGLLGPKEQGLFSERQFAANDATSVDTNPQILSITSKGSTSNVDVSFTSTQAAAEGPDGEICDDWNIHYTVSGYTIDSTGTATSTPCVSSTDGRVLGAAIQEELTTGIFPGAAAVPDAVVSCPAYVYLPDEPMDCLVQSATDGNVAVIVIVTDPPTGTFAPVTIGSAVCEGSSASQLRTIDAAFRNSGRVGC